MKRLPLLLLAVVCWSSVGATHDWEEGGLDKRSTEEGDCLQDCKKDHPTLSIQACLQKCQIGKRSTEEASPPYEGPPSGPPGGGFGHGKRSTEGNCWSDCLKRTDYDNCTLICGFYGKRSVEDEKLSAQDPPPQPWQVNGPGKRSAEQYWTVRNETKDRILDEQIKCAQNCRKGANWTWHFCLERCNNITKRSTEEVSAQDPPPQPWQVNGPGKRLTEKDSCWVDCLKRGRAYSNCIDTCGCHHPFCVYGKRSVEDEKLSAQDPPPQPWQVNGPGKRAAEQYWPSRNKSDLPYQEDEEDSGLSFERHQCRMECFERRNYSRSYQNWRTCDNYCKNITKRSTEEVSAQDPPPQPWQVNGPGKRSAEDEKLSAQDPPPQPWQVNGPGKRSAEESSCWGDCVAQGGHSANCAQACDGCFPPQCTYRGDGKRSTEDEKLSAQDPPPQPWQVNGPGKRSEDNYCMRSCQAEGSSWHWCVMRCHGPGKRSIEETLGL